MKTYPRLRFNSMLCSSFSTSNQRPGEHRPWSGSGPGLPGPDYGPVRLNGPALWIHSRMHSIAAALVVLLLMAGAVLPARAAGLPIATTDGFSSLTSTTVVFDVTFGPNGLETVGRVQYGTNTSYGTLSSFFDLPPNSPILSVGIPSANGLTPALFPGLTYHFRATASNSAGVTLGVDRTFTPPALRPFVTTLAATDVTQRHAYLAGQMTVNDAVASSYFQYGTTTSYGLVRNVASDGPGTYRIENILVTNLLPNTSYHFRMVGSNSVGTTFGHDMVFTTPAATSPTVVTLAASGITSTNATLAGTLNPNGADSTVFFQIGIGTNLNLMTHAGMLAADNSSVAVSQSVTPLSPGTLYSYRLVASNSVGISRGTVLTFTTISLPAEINVMGNGVAITDGDGTPNPTDGTDFGSVSVSSGAIVRTFTVQNLGNVGLNLTGNPKVAVSGANAVDFTVTSQPTSPVVGGGSTLFQVTFNPGAAGLRSATLSISNDDSNENPYNFAIQGTGVDPKINVTGNGLSILDGDTTPSAADGTDFGSQSVAAGTVVKMFTITNAGTAVLNVTNIALSGGQALDFAVAGITLPASIAAHASATFTITFNPSGLGLRATTVNITNNVPANNPYNFAIQGMGTMPRLTIVRGAPGQATISWTPATAGFVLQESLSLAPPVWNNSASGATNPVTVSAGLLRKFYRAIKP